MSQKIYRACKHMSKIFDQCRTVSVRGTWAFSKAKVRTQQTKDQWANPANCIVNIRALEKKGEVAVSGSYCIPLSVCTSSKSPSARYDAHLGSKSISSIP